ncbi:MAG: 3-dehydroquinate synthase [Clostridia bacterium]|nr:3-dehydroquinate synthase [Clostridia bacterium]
MKEITINTSKQYSVLIEEGLLAKAGEELGRICEASEGRKVCLVCDSNVYGLYGRGGMPLCDSLLAAGYDVYAYVFKPGEQYKTLATVEALTGFLSENGFTRSDCIAALGGGVTGDIAGFAASIFMRGISFIQIPTSLLAAADSSAGGKTGVNTDAGKNMLGTFWQPDLVLFDPDTLNTLPADQLLNGLAEIIKCAFIADGSILDAISDGLPEAAAKAIEVKKEIVERDERESGERRLLNLGHTIGHAIEKCSAYTVPHGAAVISGMYLVSLAADSLGWSEEPVAHLIRTVMDAFGFELIDDYSAEELAAAALHDKKRSGDSITIVYPDSPGHSSLKAIPAGELEAFISCGLEKGRTCDGN